MKQLLITIAALVLVGCGNKNEVREWPSRMILNGKAKVSLKSKYRDEKLQFKAELRPYKLVEKAYRNLNWDGLSSSYPELTIEFKDSDDFPITHKEFRVGLMKVIKDADSNVPLYLIYDGSISISKEKYKLIDSYTVSWSGKWDGIN